MTTVPIQRMELVFIDDNPVPFSFTQVGDFVEFELQQYEGFRLAVDQQFIDGNGVISITGSDNGMDNWTPHPIEDARSPSGRGSDLSVASSVGKWSVWKKARYIKITLTSKPGGATGAVLGTYTRAGRMAPRTTQQVYGASDHGAVAFGFAVPVGGTVRTAIDKTLATGDRAEALFSRQGQLITAPFSVPELQWWKSLPEAGLTDTAAVDLYDEVEFGALASDERLYLTSVELTVDADTGVVVEVRDDTPTTPKVLGRWFVPPRRPLVVPLPQPAFGALSRQLFVVPLSASKVHGVIRGYRHV